MKKLGEYYNKFEAALLGLSLAFTLVLIFVQVFCRTVLNSSLSWSEELARYIFVWQSWLGLSLAERDNSHIRIEIVKNFLSPRAKKILEYIVMILTFGTAIFLMLYGFKVVGFFMGTGATSPANKIPMWLLYLSLPVSCAVYCIRLIARFIGIARGKVEVV